MPIVFIVTGAVFIITGLKGDPSQLWELIQGDFYGPNNFIYWLISIFVLGALGYIDALKGLSRLFIILVVLVLLVSNRGFFAQVQDFINSSSSSKTGVTNG